VGSHFSYLNSSARPQLGLVRELLETWLSRYTAMEKAELRARLRSPDNWDHAAAFFDLFLHELLVTLECSVIPHPVVLGTNKRPDFLVTSSSSDRFCLEATICSDKSPGDRAKESRINAAYDALNELDSPYFFLRIEMNATGRTQISGHRVRAFVRRKLRDLDPDQIRDGGVHPIPKWHFNENGWSIEFQPIAKSIKTRGQAAERPIRSAIRCTCAQAAERGC
jgi:hypothetical protein